MPLYHERIVYQTIFVELTDNATLEALAANIVYEEAPSYIISCGTELLSIVEFLGATVRTFADLSDTATISTKQASIIHDTAPNFIIDCGTELINTVEFLGATVRVTYDLTQSQTLEALPASILYDDTHHYLISCITTSILTTEFIGATVRAFDSISNSANITTKQASVLFDTNEYIISCNTKILQSLSIVEGYTIAWESISNTVTLTAKNATVLHVEPSDDHIISCNKISFSTSDNLIAEVNQAEPKADLTATHAFGTTADFDACDSTDPDGSDSLLEYNFNPGDGSGDLGWQNDCLESYTYANSGTYTVEVQVRDGDGYTDIAFAQVTV